MSRLRIAVLFGGCSPKYRVSLELAGIPVVGCGVLTSALCMDKDRAHKLAQAAGVNVPASIIVGDIKIGDSVKIGAGAAVFTDVPDHSTVVAGRRA